MGNQNAGRYLRELRERSKLGIKTVAPRADVTYSYLSKIENGHREPSKQVVERLCGIYGSDPEEVLAKLGELPDDIAQILEVSGKEAFDLLRAHFLKEGDDSD